MKITKREINIVLCLLGVLIAYFAYQFGYKDFVAKTEDLKAQNARLEQDISIYEAWVVHEQEFAADTLRMDEQINDWFRIFPSNTLVDDEIKLAYQLDNDNLENYLFINTLAFGEREAVYTTNYGAHSSTETTDLLSPITIDTSLYPTCTIYKYPVNMSLKCTYAGFKNFISRLYSGNKRRAIENLNLSTDASTGQLIVSVSLNAYYVTGMDKGYTQPDLPAVRIGTENIFGTVDVMLPDYVSGDTSESESAETDVIE